MNNSEMEPKPMKSKSNIMMPLKISLLACAIVLFGLARFALQAAPEKTKQDATAASQSKQKQFNTPKEATDSLVQAAESFDVAALTEILGPDSKDILSSEDPVADKNRAVAFAAKAKEKNNVGMDPKNPNRAIITVGNDDFPLPIPIVKNKGKWMFDTKVGREEILNRRIGTNELDAIAICRGFVEAQQEYALEKHDDSKVNQYAQRIISTPGKHDGLAWQNADGTWAGPVGETIAKALEQGYTQKAQPQPFHGYYFKVLKGLKTFMVGPNGVVYEKDLGPDTLKVFESMDRFNPDKSWKPTDDQWPEEEEVATQQGAANE